MQNQKRILICPLDWGLGHASRCIPIIRLLIQKNAEVIIASDGRPLELLKHEFPNLQFIIFKGYSVDYPKSGSMIFKMLSSIPKILIGIKEEQLQLNKIIRDNSIDIVISDNRYGCSSDKVKSIFLTHQLMIKTPFGESILRKKVLDYIQDYDECWIPDFEGPQNLSGDLSHKYPLPENTFFIGPLSRFEDRPATPEKIIYDVMAIVSGPEPQRTKLKNILLEQLQNCGLTCIMVCGETESSWEEKINDRLTLVSHLSSEEMQLTILNSKVILARSGYSTIMDLAVLGKKAIFIPTPGQTEQEYLAEEMKEKKIALYQKQSRFDLKKALEESKDYKGFEKIRKNDLLEKRLEKLI